MSLWLNQTYSIALSIRMTARILIDIGMKMTQKIAPHEVEFRVIRPDGTVRWIGHACQPVFAPDGHFLGTRGSNRDITERKRAEEALRESEQKILVIAENIPALFSYLDANGCYRFINKRYEK